MTHPIAWDSDSLKAKAVVYFDRAFAVDHDDPVFAFWCHMALEQLARSAVAAVSPALLGANRKPESLLYGLGLADSDPLKLDSASSIVVYDLCKRLVVGFGPSEQATCEEARGRRNAELHSSIAAMENLPRGWIGRFFAACRVLVRHLGLDLADILEADRAALVERLIVEDAERIRDGVRAAISKARDRVVELPAAERSRREDLALAELHSPARPIDMNVFAQPVVPSHRLLKELPCPACKTHIALRGEVVGSNQVRLDNDRQLIETRIAIPLLLVCPVCELRLDGVSELTVAGLGDPVTLTDYADPIETFGIDLDDYRDEFLQSLADDYAYQDE